METIIKAEGITKEYKDIKVVNNVSFSIERGKIYGFVGPNGAGKTTTIKILLGMIRPTSGKIQIMGKDLEQSREEILGNIGALVEGPAYYGDLNAYDNMRIVALMKKVSAEKIKPILETIGLGQTGNKKVKKFSLGMKQRLSIAQALLGEPQLIILDEPVNGLDPSGIHEIRQLILALKEKKNMTVFVSSHLLSELEMIADEVIIIKDGSIIYNGQVDGLKKINDSNNLEEAYLSLINKKGVNLEW